MHVQVIEASLFFFIFSLGLFLGAGVRPLLVAAMQKEPVLIGPILTAMFSRYNLLALTLSCVCLVLEAVYAPSLIRLILAGATTALLALKLPIDKVIKRREGSGQVRGVEAEGMQLDRLHQLVEGATAAILSLALASFVLSLTQK
jgi:hypothetical protein